MIHKGGFKDGTYINKVTQNGEGGEKLVHQDSTPYTPDLDAQPNLGYLSTSLPKASPETLTMGDYMEKLVHQDSTPYTPDLHVQPSCDHVCIHDWV